MVKLRILLLAIVLVLVALPANAFAQLTSPNYQVNETFFGIGGELEAGSANYKARLAAGELTVGNTASGNYQSWVGFNTTDVELLEVAVAGGSNDLDVLDAATPKYASTTFAVRNYLSSGYVVRIVGKPPTNSGFTNNEIAAMATTAVSSPGTEQFGINLRANTNPPVGADPSQAPDSTFSFGAAATGYNVIDQFKYVENDVIASSSSSTGTTDYTISFIMNISTITPSGQYGGSYFVIAIPTF